MLRRYGLLGCAAAMLALAGCGGEETPQPSSEAASAAEAKPKATDDTPDGAVTVFLEAVRTGDDAVAAEMLTKLARQKTEEMELVVAPPGGDDMTYEVGEVESVSKEIAHVACMWSDGEEDHDVVWALRKEKAGWRIAGMATQLEGVPLLLNFEDPEDMFRQQDAVDEEIARRDAARDRQARRVNHEEEASDPGDEEEPEIEPTGRDSDSDDSP